MSAQSLYIHLPWCVRKCPYCDFNSHKMPTHLPQTEYIDALIADFTTDLDLYPSQTLKTIFFGGGTPSLFDAHTFQKLLSELQCHIAFDASIEITLEANPGTVEQARFRDYLALGINRLSLGIQSFNAQHLKRLGRIHNGTDAQRAIAAARSAGCTNLNLDIMYGLPEQTIEEAIADLTTALSYEPEHLSWYQLTLEPNTYFYKYPPKLPEDDYLYEIETQGLALLQAHGYHRYEISAFCKSKHECQHNLNYWLFGDYFGIGAGACGKVTSKDELLRTRKYRQPSDYLAHNKPFLAAIEPISLPSQLFELILNTSRLEQPIPFTLFTEKTKVQLEDALPKLIQAQAKGWITLTDTHWQVTPLGRNFTNDLQAFFLEEK